MAKKKAAKRKRVEKRAPAARKQKEVERINAGLPVVSIETLREDPENARLHSERNLESIRFSLERFGQQKPVVAMHDGTVVAGNGLLVAARVLGWKRLAAVVLPEEMTVDDARAFALMDNRTAELSEWDFEAVAITLRTLQHSQFPIESLGWLDYELQPLLNATFTPAGEEDGTGDDQHHGVAPIKVTAEQREVFERALARMRTDDGEMTEGRAVEFLAAEFLS